MSKSYAKAHKQLQHRLDDLNSMAKRSGRPTLRMLLDRSALKLSHFWYTVASEQNRSHRFFNEKLFIEKETAKGGLKYLSQFLRQKKTRPIITTVKWFIRWLFSTAIELHRLKHWTPTNQRNMNMNSADYARLRLQPSERPFTTYLKKGTSPWPWPSA